MQLAKAHHLRLFGNILENNFTELSEFWFERIHRVFQAKSTFWRLYFDLARHKASTWCSL